MGCFNVTYISGVQMQVMTSGLPEPTGPTFGVQLVCNLGEAGSAECERYTYK